jgi:hypothetical protein
MPKEILITTKQPFEFIDSQSSSLLKGHLHTHTQLISPTRVPMDLDYPLIQTLEDQLSQLAARLKFQENLSLKLEKQLLHS